MLNWGGWSPLSKLSYAAYLIHMFVLTLKYSNSHTLIYVDEWSPVSQSVSCTLADVSVSVLGVSAAFSIRIT